MSRNIVGILATLFVLAAVALWPQRPGSPGLPQAAAQLAESEQYEPRDPALAWHTRGHSEGYGGIDRWAYAGMPGDWVQLRLTAAGYSCRMPQQEGVGGMPEAGVHDMLCMRRIGWPARRNLAITAQLDYGHNRGGQLVSAQASTTPEDGQGEILTQLLRALGRAEPATLRITGFSYDNTALLARRVADLLSTNNWPWICGLGNNRGYQCSHLAELRAAGGIPPLPAQPVSVGSIDEALRSLGQAGVVSGRAMDASYGSTADLPIRMDGEDLWLDLEGRDLAGHSLKVSLRLDPDGGAPTRLEAALNAEPPIEVELRGSGRRGDPPYLLLPDTADGVARWVALPRLNDARTFDRYAAALAQTDPRFVQKAVDALLDRMLPLPADREERLGLRLELARLESTAWALRRAGLPRLAQTPVIAEAIARRFAGQAEQRAAWALARCTGDNPLQPFADHDCWLRFSVADAEGAELLRRDVGEAQRYAAGLPPSNMIRARLDQLAQQLGQPAAVAP